MEFKLLHVAQHKRHSNLRIHEDEDVHLEPSETDSQMPPKKIYIVFFSHSRNNSSVQLLSNEEIRLRSRSRLKLHVLFAFCKL